MLTWSPPSTPTTTTITLTQLPDEVQVHILAFLRSFDLGPVQQTCRFYNDPDRIHDIVNHFVHHVYGPEYTDGIIETIDPSVNNNNNKNGKPNGKNHNARNKKSSNHQHQRKHQRKSAVGHNRNGGDDSDGDTGTPAAAAAAPFRYTLGHLRSIELTVVARVLSLPEPKTGYFVSKSWIKKTLLWLEKVNDPTCHPCGTPTTNDPRKKLTKKQQRQRNRRLSDVSAPWPNVNSDIICEHQNLQRSGAKAARSHRKLMDKKSWKVLRKLYPDSTQIESVSGECLQCLMEAETARKDQQDSMEHQKLERKRSLSNPHVRRFYTRTRGVPYHCLAENNNHQVRGNGCGNDDDKTTNEGSERDDFDNHNYGGDDDGGGKIRATDNCDARRNLSLGSSMPVCPLSGGTYVILPRAWCHQWRRYIKTGEGCMPLPPDSSALLCDAHKLPLLPPHLKAFLRGETPQLYACVKEGNQNGGFSSPSPVISSVVASSVAVPRSPVGVQPVLDIETINAFVASGLSRIEVATQRMAMMRLEEEQQQRVIHNNHFGSPRESISSSVPCNNELLDRENHVVTELVTREEWLALQETGCWRNQISPYSMCVTVDKDGSFAFPTLPCRECDPTGLRFGSSCASMENIHGKSSSKNTSGKNRWRK